MSSACSNSLKIVKGADHVDEELEAVNMDAIYKD